MKAIALILLAASLAGCSALRTYQTYDRSYSLTYSDGDQQIGATVALKGRGYAK